MRTPEEILNEAIVRNSGNENWSFKEEALEAIRQAQIEAIEEAKAKVGEVLKSEDLEPLLDEIFDELNDLKNQIK